MTLTNRVVKRSFDVLASMLGLALLWPVILVAMLIARIDTKASGLFRQQRVGRHGQLFELLKLRTMLAIRGTCVTTANDSRITKYGARLRRWKLDELPQLWNVLKGDMSLVGPRPDVVGYMDTLSGEARVLLELRPGITGPATLKYAHEEDILARVDDPDTYNDTVIWPDKVRLNLEYYHNWSFWADVKYIVRSVL